MKKNHKLINIFSWVSVIISLFLYYFCVAPSIGALLFLGTLLSCQVAPAFFVYLVYLLGSILFSIIPALLFIIIDKTIFRKNYKYISFINIIICILYTLEFYR